MFVVYCQIALPDGAQVADHTKNHSPKNGCLTHIEIVLDRLSPIINIGNLRSNDSQMWLLHCPNLHVLTSLQILLPEIRVAAEDWNRSFKQ